MKWNKVVTNIHGIYRDNRQKKLLEEIITNAKANEDALISMENGAKFGVNPDDDISVFIDGGPEK